MFCVRVFGSLVFVCMLVLRFIVYALALICCHVAFHCVFCVRALGLFVGDCLLIFCVMVYRFAFVWCKVVFQITRAFEPRVCVALVFLFVCLSVYVALVGDCTRLPLCFARMRFICHACFAFVSLVCLCVLVCLFPV